MKPVLVFDVNETLLDVKVLRPLFEQGFGDPNVLKEWFDAVILYSQTITIIGEYRGFAEVAKDALHMVASSRDASLPAAIEREILEGMLSLPAHSEVAAALTTLGNAGFRLAALTNSTQTAAETQLKNAGLRNSFERVMSVDSVRRFKPAPETYAFAAKALGASPDETIMVASHPWDIQGAIRAGLQGAFLRRPGASWFGTGVTPRFTEPDLERLAETLVAACGEEADL